MSTTRYTFTPKPTGYGSDRNRKLWRVEVEIDSPFGPHSLYARVVQRDCISGVGGVETVVERACGNVFPDFKDKASANLFKHAVLREFLHWQADQRLAAPISCPGHGSTTVGFQAGGSINTAEQQITALRCELQNLTNSVEMLRKSVYAQLDIFDRHLRKLEVES